MRVQCLQDDNYQPIWVVSLEYKVVETAPLIILTDDDAEDIHFDDDDIDTDSDQFY